MVQEHSEIPFGGSQTGSGSGISLLAMDFWIPLTINYFAAGGISINNSQLRIADIYEATRNVYEHSPSKDVSQNLP